MTLCAGRRISTNNWLKKEDTMNLKETLATCPSPRGAPGSSVVKSLPVHETWFSLWVGKVPWRRKWHPMPVFSPGESHGQRSLVGYSPGGRKESNTTEQPNNNRRRISEMEHPGPTSRGSVTVDLVRSHKWKRQNLLPSWQF